MKTTIQISLVFLFVFMVVSFSFAQETAVIARRFEFLPGRIEAVRGQPLKIYATSLDVTHGFAIDAFGINRKIEKGELTVIELVPDKAGEFEIRCSVFCGIGHGGMKGKLIVSESQETADEEAMGMGSGMGRGQIDAHFIEQMIPHHEDAIAMANIALTRAEHPEIRILAREIIKAQSDEIGQMKRWYKAWFGDGMGHGMGMMRGAMMGGMTDIATLKSAKPFDKEFIGQMIPHHQMAVMMAQMLARSTSRPEMKQLAENIISAQTKEINQMREWHRIWYGG